MTRPIARQLARGLARQLASGVAGTSGGALLVGDRYISPTGSDSADGLTRATAWATVARLNTWVASLTTGTYKAVVMAGTYANSNGFYSNNNNAINLTVDFEPGVTINTSAAVTKQDGISVENNPTSSFAFNLRGAEFVGNAVSSANGIGTTNNVNLVINGGGAEFSLYDDGVSFHATSGAAEQIQINDCRFYQCTKSAFVHVVAAKGTHNRCVFEGHTGATIGIGRCDSPGSNFYDCTFLNRGSANLGFFDSIVERCQLGETDAFVVLSGRITAGMQGISNFNDCYLNTFGDTRIWFEGGGMTECYGFFSFRERAGTGTMVGGEFRNCVFVNAAITRNADIGHTKLNFIDCVFEGGSFGASFSATQISAWNADSGWDHCCLFGASVLAGIAGSVVDSITTDPILGPANTTAQADWAVANNSPCIGAGTAGGNIGFTLADIS